MRLSEHRYRTVSAIRGPLLFLENVIHAKAGEIVKIISDDGLEMEGEILRIEGSSVLIEVYGDTRGLGTEKTTVILTDSIKQVPLSMDIIGRVLSGSFRSLDGMDIFIPEIWAPVTGFPMNPTARARPEEFIETGISAIDGLNTLVKGQKLPIFSSAGLPSKEVAGMILKNARLRDTTKRFLIVFAAIGLTFHEYSFYMNVLEEMKTDFVAFINMADDPVMERLLTPRFALTVAEYLAFRNGMDVLVVITDMTNYADALREVSTAREELPGRRGYPGYMYSDLASIYERAGRIKGMEGSITLMPILTMPEEDITHPVPDLTGYITEGQIVLSRELHQKRIFPPIDVLPSLSRLMQHGIGPGRTREDHRKIANSLYRYYSKGRDLRKLEAIVGREGLSESDRLMLDFSLVFESEFINQTERRTIDETLDKGLEIMEKFSLRIR